MMTVPRPKPNEALAAFLTTDPYGQSVHAGLMAWVAYWREGAAQEAMARGDTDYAKGKVFAFDQVLKNLTNVIANLKPTGDTQDTPA